MRGLGLTLEARIALRCCGVQPLPSACCRAWYAAAATVMKYLWILFSCPSPPSFKLKFAVHSTWQICHAYMLKPQD